MQKRKQALIYCTVSEIFHLHLNPLLSLWSNSGAIFGSTQTMFHALDHQFSSTDSSFCDIQLALTQTIALKLDGII